MRTFFIGLAAVALLALAACGGAKSAGTGPATVTMDSSSFSTRSVTIKAGQTITFTTQTTGAMHFLTTGTNNTHSDEADAPAQFASANGVEVDPGQSLTVAFPTAGTFHITCTIHPGMDLTVTVQP